MATSAGWPGCGPGSSSACGWRPSPAITRRPGASSWQSHGLFTWGDDDRDGYETTLEVIGTGRPGLAERATGAERRSAAGRPPAAARVRSGARWPAAFMPRLRGLVSAERRKIGHFDDSPPCSSSSAARRSSRWRRSAPPAPTTSCAPRSGPWSCPSIRRRGGRRALIGRAAPALDAYRADYAAYYDRCRRAGLAGHARPQPGGLPDPRRRHDHLRRRQAHRPHRRANSTSTPSTSCARRAAVSTYRGLPEQAAFDIEYWPLEEAKLKRLPPPQAARRPRSPWSPAAPAASARRPRGGSWPTAPASSSATSTATPSPRPSGARRASSATIRVRAVWVDVTDEAAVAELFAETALAFGGLDICVSNAGIASAAPIEDTSSSSGGATSTSSRPATSCSAARPCASSRPRRWAARIDLHRLEERAGRLAGRVGLRRGQGQRAASRARRWPSSARRSACA